MAKLSEIGFNEITRWDWECPIGTCQEFNILEDKDIEWRDTTPVIKCEGCKEEFIFTFREE